MKQAWRWVRRVYIFAKDPVNRGTEMTQSDVFTSTGYYCCKFKTVKEAGAKSTEHIYDGWATLRVHITARITFARAARLLTRGRRTPCSIVPLRDWCQNSIDTDKDKSRMAVPKTIDFAHEIHNNSVTTVYHPDHEKIISRLLRPNDCINATQSIIAHREVAITVRSAILSNVMNSNFFHFLLTNY